MLGIMLLVNVILCIITAFHLSPELRNSHQKWNDLRSRVALEGQQDKELQFRQGKTDLETLKSRIPVKRDFIRVLGDIMETASSNKVDAGGLTYKPEPVKGQNLTAYAVSMNTSGSYISVKSFLADMLASDDLVVVDDFSMTNSDALSEQVSMNLRLTVYLREGA